MRTRELTIVLTDTSPAATNTKISAPVAGGGGMLTRAEKLVIDAVLTAGAGGTLDVYLQRKIATNSWLDWVHFPQVTAGATKRYTVTITGDGPMVSGNIITEVGSGTDTTAAPVLAANSAVNCGPCGDVRLVLVAGAGQTAGATNTVTITPLTERN